MDLLNNLEENMTYEVLVLTRDGESTNIKPFGLRYVDEYFVFDFFPNKTLLNIKKTNKLTVYFLYDALMFTKALLDDLTIGELEDSCHFSLVCDVKSIDSAMICDSYGKNVLTRIMAKPTKIITKKDTLPIISRATNHIIELLVDFSRYEYMDVHARNKFKEKLDLSEKIIEKTGNNKHKKAINLIKNRIE